MVLEKRSLAIIGGNKLLDEVRAVHEIFHTIKVLTIDHKKIPIKTFWEDRRKIHFYELLLIDSTEVLNKYFEFLKRHKYIFFNESINLIS